MSNSSWHLLLDSKRISGDRWMKISTMWVTAPSTGSNFIGNPSNRRFVATLYGLKVEVGSEDDRTTPEWVHVVRQRHERGDLEEIRRLLSVADSNGQPEAWMITKANSPEYDFGRWLQAQLKRDWEDRLRGLALAHGIDVKKGETSPEEILNKTERLLINRSYTVPTIGLDLAPFRAIVVLGLILLYLLLSIRSAVRQAVGNREAETGDLWLPLDAEGRGERLAAAAWASVIVATPWIIAVGLVHMTLRQFVVDGSVPAMRIILVSVASLAYALCTSWVAMTMLSMVASLRLERQAHVSSAIE